MMDELSDVRRCGTLRIISSFGFGRRVVAPALSALALQYPQLELRFDVRDRLVDLVNEGVDLDIRVGDDIAPNLIARQLAANHRVLCASPQFLARHAPPKQLSDLAALPCLVIKERDHPFGVWQLHSKEGQHAIKVTGPLSNLASVVSGRAGDCAPFVVGRPGEYRQRTSGAGAAGLLAAGQRLGGLRLPAGDVG